MNRAWTQLGLLLHRIVNPIVMGIIFYGAITPLGLVMRWAGRDPLRLRRDPAPRPTGSSGDRRGRHRTPWPISSEVIMASFVKELWMFMRVRRKFWMLPILLLLALFGGLIVLTQGTAIAPFIYTLF